MKETILPLILKYLRQNQYIESYISLEAESKIASHHYSREVEFFKRVLMKGDFSKAVEFLWTFEDKISEQSLREFSLDLYRQKLYELVENPDEEELKVLFEKEIVNFCSENEYQQLFTMLTCKSVKEIEGMAGWSALKGRYECFQKIYPTLQSFFAMPHYQKNEPKVPEFTIDDAISAYLQKEQNPSNILSVHSRRHPSVDKESIDEKSVSQTFQNVEKSGFSKNSGFRKVGQDLEELQLNESGVQKSPEASKSKMEGSQSVFNKKYNPYMDEKVNPSGIMGRSKETEKGYSNMYNKQPLKLEDIDEDENKSRPLSYIKSQNESNVYEEQVRKNIAYLDHNNSSAVYRDPENENFTFSHGTEDSGLVEKNKKVLKLASVTDPKAIRTCQFSSTANYFALGTNSSYLKIFGISQLFQMNTPRQILPVYQIPQLHSKSIFCLDWSLNEKAIITCSNDLTIKITEFPEGFNYATHHTSNIGRHESCIRMVKFNATQTQIISCGDDSLIKIWDIGKNKKCTNLKGHTQSVSGFKFAGEEENILYSVSKDSTIRKWDLRMQECVTASQPQDSEITYIANHIDRIVVSHKNGCVSFFSDDLKLEHSCQIHEQEIRSIDGLSYDDTLLTASFDGHISLFAEANIDSPNYHQHNDLDDDKVVYATFLNHPHFSGFASTSTMGICNIFSYE